MIIIGMQCRYCNKKMLVNSMYEHSNIIQIGVGSIKYGALNNKHLYAG